MRYEEFISEVRKRARLASTEEATEATRATLATLAERLRGNEADALAARLPRALAHFMITYDVGRGNYGLDEFFRLVSTREGVALADGEYHARVVIGLLAETVSVGEIEDVQAQLPPDFAHLFAVENAGEIPELGAVADVDEENA